MNSFFIVSGCLLFWVVGFLIYVIILSVIMFMFILEKVFLIDWLYIVGNIVIVVIILLFIYFYVLFFKKLKVIFVYEYLEVCFGFSICVIGFLLFVVYYLGCVVIVIYLLILVIIFVLDMNFYIVVLFVGLLCILYIFLGGFEGVVWSDFI